MAAGHELRSQRRTRRQLRLEQNRGLLHLAAGARLRRRSPSSTTTSSARKRCRRWKARCKRKKVTFAWDNKDVVEDSASRCSRRPARTTSSSTCRCRTTRRVRSTPSCKAERSSARRCSRGYSYQRAQDALARLRRRAVCKARHRSSRSSGARRTAAPRRRPSSATSRLRCKVVVGPTPYAQQARETYHQGWRTAANQ